MRKILFTIRRECSECGEKWKTTKECTPFQTLTVVAYDCPLCVSVLEEQKKLKKAKKEQKQ